MKKLLMMAALLAMAPLAQAQVTVIIDEDFESYANTAAMEAVWTASQPGVIVLSDVAGTGAEGSDKFITLPGASAASLTRTFTAHTVTDADPVNISVYLRAANWGNTRTGASVRSANLSALLLNLGTFNSTSANNDGTANKYAARALGWGGFPSATGSNGYYHFLAGPDRTPNVWVNLSAIAGATEIAFTIDGYDEVIDNLTAPADDAAATRIGLGVSNNQDVNVDSLVISHGLAVSSVSEWELFAY